MWRSGTRVLAMACLLVASLASCGGNDIAEPPAADPGVTAGGLNFVVQGSGYSTASGALPAADPTVAAPIVTLTGSPTAFAAAQLVVSAVEPFQAALLLPVGSPTYARIAMPGNATLVGITTMRVATSSFLAQQLQVAIVRGGKVSVPVTISLLTPIN